MNLERKLFLKSRTLRDFYRGAGDSGFGARFRCDWNKDIKSNFLSVNRIIALNRLSVNIN